ncbi:hypothetical protein Ddye_018854 [Dipteronia dyeriana]|uniref:CCHC-type domain-containing protein n=1 Tax=Dipteronia dyeriana TaxID=168575 RepID=A0AAD9TWP6_9ROSI|nr:hypothetical protein Ddye_018854 [Dipteronia dyeriana]
MQCCSLDKRDIDFHYRRMSFRYHELGGINNELVKGELQRMIELSGKSLIDITLGEIHMFTLTALDKLCTTQIIFSKMLRKGKKYDNYCKLPDSYRIKCKSMEHYNCRPYRHSRRQPKKEKIFSSNKKNSKYKYYRKKARRSWNKSNKCFTCEQQGHYTKQCPNKITKSAKLIQQLRQIVDEVPSDVDIESIFSEQDEVNPHTTFMIQDSDNSSVSLEFSNFSEPDLPSEAYQVANKSDLRSPNSSPNIDRKILQAYPCYRLL